MRLSLLLLGCTCRGRGRYQGLAWCANMWTPLHDRSTHRRLVHSCSLSASISTSYFRCKLNIGRPSNLSVSNSPPHMFTAGGQHIFWAFATGAKPPSSKPHFGQFAGFHLLEYVVLHFGQAPCPLPLEAAIPNHTLQTTISKPLQLHDIRNSEKKRRTMGYTLQNTISKPLQLHDIQKRKEAPNNSLS